MSDKGDMKKDIVLDGAFAALLNQSWSAAKTGSMTDIWRFTDPSQREPVFRCRSPHCPSGRRSQACNLRSRPSRERKKYSPTGLTDPKYAFRWTVVRRSYLHRVYCRSVCPARTPSFHHYRFFGSATAAQEAGFRSCMRCPARDHSGLSLMARNSNTVFRALALIAVGDRTHGAKLKAIATLFVLAPASVGRKSGGRKINEGRIHVIPRRGFGRSPFFSFPGGCPSPLLGCRPRRAYSQRYQWV